MNVIDRLVLTQSGEHLYNKTLYVTSSAILGPINMNSDSSMTLILLKMF